MRDVKISEAKFFPKPPSVFEQKPCPLDPKGVYARAYATKDKLAVIVSVAVYDDGREWLHVSMSRKNRIPSYSDIVLVKQSFIGVNKKAVMVFPEQENHVNIHNNCLHLFYCAENPLPEFSGFIGGMRSI